MRLMTLGHNRGKASEEAEPVVREPNDFQDTRSWLDLLRCKRRNSLTANEYGIIDRDGGYT